MDGWKNIKHKMVARYFYLLITTLYVSVSFLDHLQDAQKFFDVQLMCQIFVVDIPHILLKL